jgi:hypothetical protein
MSDSRFHSVREAKEFLASRIVDEAEREGTPLSEIERKMLYFSEVGWTLPDMMQVSDEFDRQYDQNDYEHRVAQLIAELDRRLRKDSQPEYQDWRSAAQFLKRKDHYINVMIGQAGLRPPGDRLKLWMPGFALAVLFVAGLGVAAKYSINFAGVEKYLPSKQLPDGLLRLCS